MNERTRIRVEVPRGEPTDGVEPTREAGVLAAYLRDASLRTGRAEALFRPRNEADVSQIVARAQREGIPLTVVAAQTSTTGSSVADGGWILSMERLDRIGAIDATTRRAHSEAGANLGAFARAVEARGLFYPPDPTSRDDCTLGGTVACNASGARSHRFGPTRNWIRALRIVLPCGEVIALERGDRRVRHGVGFEIEHGQGCALGAPAVREVPVPGFAFAPDVKNATGLFGGEEIDPIDLFIGSEGMLGVVTEVEVDLLPRPVDQLDLFITFGDEDEAVRFVEELRMASRLAGTLRADAIEWFDRASLDLIAEDGVAVPVRERVRVALFVEQLVMSDDPPSESVVEAWFQWLSRFGLRVDDPDAVRVAATEREREALRRARHAVPVGVNERAARNDMPKLATDFAVGHEHLRDVMALYREARDAPLGLLAEGKREGLPDRVASVTFGHVGDNHLHMNFLPTTQAERGLAECVRDELTQRVIAWGGSPSAEHGIGKTKRQALLQRVGPEAAAQMCATRRAFDPRELLGRGNLFEPDSTKAHGQETSGNHKSVV